MKYRDMRKRITVFLLCLAMLIPSYPVRSAASMIDEASIQMEPEELQQLDEGNQALLEETMEEITKTSETVAADIADTWDGDAVIYWNPGGSAQEVETYFEGTPGKASKANAKTQVSKGSDHANGLTPYTAVENLNTAIRRAEKLSRQLEIDVSDVTIYAMNPMTVPKGTAYNVRGKGVTVAPWGERSYEADYLFIVEGGQLALNNIVIQPEDGATAPDESQLIHVSAGTVQLGEQVEAYGTFVLDYTLSEPDWEWASQSETSASVSQAGEYQEPLIELTKKFNIASEYILDLHIPSDREADVTAVKSLYSDEAPAEEFMEAFTILDVMAPWELLVEERVGGVLRDTTDLIEADQTASEAQADQMATEGVAQWEASVRSAQIQDDLVLTQKSLIARSNTRADRIIYWNPGPALVIGNRSYPAGKDTDVDGTTPEAAFKSFDKALQAAQGGRIVCMQTINLGTDASGYLPVDGAGNYRLDGLVSTRVTVCAWSRYPQALIRIPDGKTLSLKNLNLVGVLEDGVTINEQTIICEGGQLILEGNVQVPESERGVIQIELNGINQAHNYPIIVEDSNVIATLYYNGIEDNLDWVYTDVVIAGSQLLTSAGSEHNAGDILLQNIRLADTNTITTEDGGISKFKWSLRKDTLEDDLVEKPSHLELYAKHYYDAIYLDGVRGNEVNLGATCTLPVKTFARAKTRLHEEMQNSLNARQEAFDAGRDWEAIALPRTIYICGTVTVSDVQIWDLPSYTDIDGTPIKIEVLSHVEPVVNTATEQPVHQVPDILVYVDGAAASLTLGDNLLFRNMVNKTSAETYSFVVVNGAGLTLKANADISGLADLADITSQVLGTHILVGKNPGDGTVSSGKVELAANWSGAIHSRQYGIYAYGSATQIKMLAGSINNHMNKYTSFNNNQYTAGVYLNDATMVMSGGEIAENTSNLGGAGVYLEGSARLEMLKGVIRENVSRYCQIDSDTRFTTVNLHALGTGVFVGNGATFDMGTSGGDNADCLITEQNINAKFKGVGVYVAVGGTYHLYSGTVSRNYGAGHADGNTSHANYSRGAGIASYGAFYMEDGLITENRIATIGYGGGLFAEPTALEIKGGTFSKNMAARSYDPMGGGIYIENTGIDMSIENVLFTENRGRYGGGLAIAQRNGITQGVNKITINDCVFDSNIATVYNIIGETPLTFQSGGGMYAAATSNLTIDAKRLIFSNNQAYEGGGFHINSVNPTFEDVLIEDNIASYRGGGAYINSTARFLNGVIKGNTATTEHGGGICHVGGTVLMSETQIIENVAGSWSGGYCQLGGNAQIYGALIKDNRSMNGAGYSSHGSGTRYLTDVKILDNRAENYAGGLASWAGTLIVNETVPGGTQISGNTAALGGGIAMNSGNFYLDIAGPLENEATTQGHNLYFQNNIVAFLQQGEFLQPAGSAAGIYNAYAASEVALSINIDPQKVSISGADQFYADSPNVQLKYLQNPLATTPPDFAVSVNAERYKAGNIVVRPYGSTANWNLTLQRVVPNLGGIQAYTITYPASLNAATDEGLDYAKGGVLPPRTVLAGEEDPDVATRKNIVLLGQGVYLDGINGNDSNTGSDPEHAVKTFKQAKALLELYTDASNADSSDTDGFPPFIYLCGTVTLDGSNAAESYHWVLDREEARYTTDSKYRAVEIAAGREPEEPQVRRYSAFVKKPMIKVENGQTLIVSNLIIDGLMQSVDKTKQGQNSRIFEVKDADLILQDRAHIRNNYWNMIKVDHGTLQMTSSTPDGGTFRNQQLELTSGIGVELENDSVMTMDGYATILFSERMYTSDDYNIDYDNTAVLAGRGVIARTGSSLTMNDDSKIQFLVETGYNPHLSGATGVVLGTRTDIGQLCKIQMNDRAEIRNCLNAIALSEFKADVTMTGKSTLVDNYYGIRSRANKVKDGLSIVLTDEASIYCSDTLGTWRSNVGIYFHDGVSALSSLVEIKLSDEASIYNGNHGIYIHWYHGKVKITMNDDSSIHDSKNGYGINMDNGNNDADFELVMEDRSSIYNTSNFGIRSYHSDGVVTITMKDDSIIHDISTTAIYVDDFHRAPAYVYLQDSAVIEKASNGIYYNYFRSMLNNEESLISMTNDSRITVTGTGIVSNNFYEPIRIEMKENARIVDTTHGITLQNPQGTLVRAVISMTDDAWLGASATGQMRNAIYLYNDVTDRVTDRSGWYQIQLSDNALIGGDSFSTGTTAKRGLTERAIYATRMPFDLQMTDQARISYTGLQTVFLTDENNPRMLGKTTISMKDQTKLNHSLHRAVEIQSQRDVEMVLADQVEITNNVYGSLVTGRDNITKDIEVKLSDDVYLMTPSSTNADHHTLQIAGGLTLDGTVTIEKDIYMMNGDKPITLTKPVPFGDPAGKYALRLGESYIGQLVVRPDGTTVTDATVYASYFTKARGDGLAATKNLVNQGVNIILQGENNVYLSALGVDTNNGISPTTPVRTFKRAKELLQTGYFTEGANIIICHPTLTGYQNYPVVILAGDEDWSFDSGGTITNQNSNETWKPVITGNSNFWGILLKVDSSVAGAASEVTFRDITIDSFALKGTSKSGNAENKEILRVVKGKATLGKGATFENSHNNSTGWNNQAQVVQGVRIDATGTFIIDGGTIRNITSTLLNPNAGESLANGFGLVIWNAGGVFELRNGSIEDCSAYVNQPSSVALVANTSSSRMVMSGGIICNNRLTTVSNTKTYVAGAVSFTNTATGLMTGGIIENNQGVGGSALFVNSTGKVELEGGRIRNNTSTRSGTQPIQQYSPIYVANTGFTIKGGAAVIDDAIYLDSNQHLITVSGVIYHTFRQYYIYLNESTGTNYFTKGDAVVQPDNTNILNVSGMLINFVVCSPDYILDRGQSITRSVGTVAGVKEEKCLILMKAVYLDSLNGADTQSGISPSQAVATFAKAKAVGEGSDASLANKNYFVIYLSGPAYPANGESWDLDTISYMCRYTGFPIYDKVTGLGNSGFAYHGYLVEAQGSFALGNVKIYGRRAIDSLTDHNGDSMIHVLPSTVVSMSAGTILTRNNNQGGYLDENETPISLSMRGGAVCVEPGGLFQLNGGKISDSTDSFSTAIYLAAEQVNGSTTFGRLLLNAPSVIEGGIYLAGKTNQAHAYLEAEAGYLPKTALGSNGQLRIVIENDYNGRSVIRYTDGTIPTTTQIDYYKMEDSLNAIYSLVNRSGDDHMLELSQRQVIYIDGQNGNDSNLGSSPADALKTFEGLYTRINGMAYSGGVVVFVVDRIDINSGKRITLVNKRTELSGQIKYEGEYQETDSAGNVVKSIPGDMQIFLKRYSQPLSTSAAGYHKSSYTGELIRVKAGGSLVLNGIYLDGHAEDNSSSIDYLTAPGVEAQAPLVVVQPAGYLESGYSLTQTIPSGGSGTPQVGLSTLTVFSNNHNNKLKSNTIGLSSNGTAVVEGSSAGIEILSDGTDLGRAVVKMTEFKNLSLADGIVGGTDIYQNGRLTIQEQTIIHGTVFLEGRGSLLDRSSSRTIEIGAYGTPVSSRFRTLMRDAYNTRDVCIYPSSNPNGPEYTDLVYYMLAEEVTAYFTLNKLPYPQGYIIQLNVPEVVYLDGQNGDDSANTGLVPVSPVKTLKRAYEVLAQNRGQIIYIVDQVEVAETIQLSPEKYVSGSDQVELFEAVDHVDIRRFVKPMAGKAGAHYNAEYDRETYEGTLFEVVDGATLTLDGSMKIDGHYSQKAQDHDPYEMYVDHETEVSGVLFHVEADSRLQINAGAELVDNHNTKVLSGTQTGLAGGAIHNQGVVVLNGGRIANNEALQGAGIYQSGTFQLLSNQSVLSGQEVYLTSVNTGTITDPVWEEDHVIETSVWFTEDDSIPLNVNMDHAVVGRPVVKYMIHNLVDPQYEYYELGTTVSSSLFLVENEVDDSLLELQDWRVLDIEVPKEIFLLVRQEATGQIGLSDGASDQLVLNSPQYKIKNHGRYETKVVLSGFVNDNAAAGITDFAQMTLVEQAADAVGQQELYLAVKGKNGSDPFTGLAETSLYDFDVEGVKMTEMGFLEAGEEGTFGFIGVVSRPFINHYLDAAFPFSGVNATAAGRMAHIRNKHAVTGVTSTNHARAKYQMHYRLYIEPLRR